MPCLEFGLYPLVNRKSLKRNRRISFLRRNKSRYKEVFTDYK